MRNLLGVSLVVCLVSGWPVEDRQFRDFGGFMEPVDFSRLRPAHGRSLDTAQERQGQAGAFSQPAFNIPFQPNFQFQEFGSFPEGGSGFSQLISGLGGQGLRSQSDFVRQTEQRFQRPQIGGANIGGAPFKRETNKHSQRHEDSSVHQHRQQTHQSHKRPASRYDADGLHDETTYGRPKPDSHNTFPPQLYAPEPYQPKTFQPQAFTPKIYKPFKAEPSSRPLRLADTKPAQRNFRHQFNDDSEFDFEEEMKKFDFENQKALEEPTINYEEERSRYPSQNSAPVLKVESRENTFENVNSPNLKTIFDQNPMFADAEFQQSFEPERFSFAEINKEVADEKINFNPPDLTERFRSPLKESQSYPFLDKSINEEKTNSKHRKVKPFSNFKVIDKPKETKKRKTNVQTYPHFEKFQEIPKIEAKAVSAAPTQQSTYENLPTFTHFKTKPSLSTFKTKAPVSRSTSKPRKSTKPITTTTLSPPLKTFDELPTFTNFKTITETSSKKPSVFPSKVPSGPTSKPFPSFINFKSQTEKRVQAPTQTRTYEATTSKTTEQPPAKKQTPSKKPYNYEKKNFREPLKQVSKNSGGHEIIRIKTPARQEARLRPQPKQLSGPETGFKPIAGPPGKLLIQEVNRRLGVYHQPSDVIFDNDQPLVTLDTVKPFRARSNPDSFAIDVKASFNPKPRQENKRPQRLQKRLMRLPNSQFSHLLHRRPVKSNKVAASQ